MRMSDLSSDVCSSDLAAASFGLQAGLQTFGYAIYFMNEKALSYLDNSDGWEIGTAPNVVVVDEGAGASLTTTSAKDNILVFFFAQKGLMAGVTIEGRSEERRVGKEGVSTGRSRW